MLRIWARQLRLAIQTRAVNKLVTALTEHLELRQLPKAKLSRAQIVIRRS